MTGESAVAEPSDSNQWKTLDKDLNRISQIEYATSYVARPLIGPGIALAFMVIAGLAAAVLFGTYPNNMIVVAAAVFGAYMALNIQQHGPCRRRQRIDHERRDHHRRYL